MNTATGKCPKCETQLAQTVVEHITVGNQAFGPLHYGAAILCGKCKTVLGISIDPVRMKEEIITEVLESLGVARKKRR
jgi:hypothetical protein